MKHWEDDKILNDSKWRIVYATVVNDAQLVNGSELYLCNMLNDTRHMKRWILNEVNLNDVNVNDFTNIGMIYYWVSKWIMEWYNIEWL